MNLRVDNWRRYFIYPVSDSGKIAEKISIGFEKSQKNTTTYSELKHRHYLSQKSKKKSWKLKSTEECTHSD
jgi:hypothetical protein